MLKDKILIVDEAFMERYFPEKTGILDLVRSVTHADGSEFMDGPEGLRTEIPWAEIRQIAFVDDIDCSRFLKSPEFRLCVNVESFEVKAGWYERPIQVMDHDTEGVLFYGAGDYRTMLRYPQGKKALSYSVPADVKRLEIGCFRDAVSLEAVVFLSNVYYIPSECFWGCSSLRSISGGALNSFAKRAFWGCEHITGAIIPDRFLSVDRDAFEDGYDALPDHLRELITSDNPPENWEKADEIGRCGDRAFWFFRKEPNPETGEKTDVCRFCGTGEIWDYEESYSGAIHWADRAFIERGITSIGRNAFSGSNINTLTMADTVRAIHDGAFFEAVIEKLEIPGTVRYLGSDIIGGDPSGIDELVLSAEIEELSPEALWSRTVSVTVVKLTGPEPPGDFAMWIRAGLAGPEWQEWSVKILYPACWKEKMDKDYFARARKALDEPLSINDKYSQPAYRDMWMDALDFCERCVLGGDDPEEGTEYGMLPEERIG